MGSYYSDWRKLTKQRMIDFLGGKCRCCGYKKSVWSLVFHHINPSEKEFSLCGNRMNKKNWPNMVKELEKCVLLCANCHGEIHESVKQCPSQIFNEDFREWKYLSEELEPCEICGKDKPKYKITCSYQCSWQRQYKIKWPDNLEDLVKAKNINQVSKDLGVSYNAVKKRLGR